MPSDVPPSEWRRMGAQEERNKIVLWLRDHGDQWLDDHPSGNPLSAWYGNDVRRLALAIQANEHKKPLVTDRQACDSRGHEGN